MRLNALLVSLFVFLCGCQCPGCGDVPDDCFASRINEKPVDDLRLDISRGSEGWVIDDGSDLDTPPPCRALRNTAWNFQEQREDLQQQGLYIDITCDSAQELSINLSAAIQLGDASQSLGLALERCVGMNNCA